MKYIEPFSKEMWLDFAKYMWRQVGVSLIIAVVIGYTVGTLAALYY